MRRTSANHALPDGTRCYGWMAAGTQISAAPTAGSNAEQPIATPHNTGACSPGAGEISPPSAPCSAATRMLPLMVAPDETVVNLLKRSRSCFGRSGIAS